MLAAAGFLSHYLRGPLPCLTPYNRKIKCVECVVKYNIFFLPYQKCLKKKKKKKIIIIIKKKKKKIIIIIIIINK